ncbi:ribonuclease III domain-containing protein [Abortiporus biennis]|nr:ribonuclease III domain-containing protein [Abortiporus biennis]
MSDSTGHLANPKRNPYRSIQVKFSPGDLPKLPEILDESLKTRVFTHRSYFARPTHLFEDPPEDPSPDNEMLEHLGDSVLSLVVTGQLREVYPNLRVGASTKIRALLVGNNTLAYISSQLYKLHDHLRTHPAQVITLRASLNIQGVYLDRGLEAVKQWLQPLFRPFIHEAYRKVRIEHGLPPDPDPPTMNSQFIAGSNNVASNLRSSHPQLSLSSPPPPRSVPMIGHLSLFNQHLQQSSKPIEWVYYDTEGEGTKTTPIWVVRAMVEGKCLGKGKGSTKKAAKNEAAKEGLKNMGVYVPETQHIIG